MENSDLKNKLTDMIKEFYLKYDTANNGSLSGDKKEQFMKDFYVSSSEAATFEEFKEKYFREFDYFLSYVYLFKGISELPLTNKQITFNIDADSAITPKTTLKLNYMFNEEERKNFLVQNITNEKVDVDQTILIAKIYCTNPVEAKEKIDFIIRIALILIKSKFKEFSFIRSESISFDDYIQLKLHINYPFYEMFLKSFCIMGKSFPNLTINGSLNIELKNNFEDILNYPDQDTLKSFINGSLVSLNVTSNVLNLIREGVKSKNVHKNIDLLLSFLTLLEFNADFKMKLKEVESSILCKFPPINLFDADNQLVKKAVTTVLSLKNNLPIVKKIFELCDMIKGNFEFVLNSPFGLFNLNITSGGLMDLWGVLATIHSI